MSFIKEFKEFATKGNVMDLAVGVIIGGAFGKIVDSVVNDLIMPLVGIFFKADFSNLYLPLSRKITKGLPLAEARKLGPVFAWGNFITVVLNFIILAFIIFILIKMMNTFRRKNEESLVPPPPPPPSNTEQLLMEIRDLLKK
jgi:large conductance mechanosensitive channel